MFVAFNVAPLWTTYLAAPGHHIYGNVFRTPENKAFTHIPVELVGTLTAIQ